MERVYLKEDIAREAKEKTPHNTMRLLAEDYLLKPSLFTSLSYVNFVYTYCILLAILAGYDSNPYWVLFYLPLAYSLTSWRKNQKERDRLQIAHRIPFFADALANSLSVGTTLEKAFKQASYYLKGKIKHEFDALVIKNTLGKDLGKLLWELEYKFPNTGLKYLISLLEEYRELGVGITPLLKKISTTLAVKEEAEAKILTILSVGSGYARISIGIFLLIFLGMSILLKEQVQFLFSPQLKPTCLFLMGWTCLGIFLITRLTAIDFTRSAALRPYIKDFMKHRKFSLEDLLDYSGLDPTPLKLYSLRYSPLLSGFIFSYIGSWYQTEALGLLIYFSIGTWLCGACIRFILEGLMEDQLIKTIETFPEFLQVFVVGLNSGLNTYLAFQFAQHAITGDAPRVLTRELTRTQFAMECGEKHAHAWQLLAQKLPFETVIDFSEIMVIAPMHGESIVQSINQMTSSYQAKKLSIIEKKATSIGQMVIPFVVVSFFPLFLFVIFGPLIVRISSLMN